MQANKVYVLHVWSTDGWYEFGNYTKVFKTKAGAMKYVKTYLDLEWHPDGYSGECRDDYTLNQAEVL